MNGPSFVASNYATLAFAGGSPSASSSARVQSSSTESESTQSSRSATDSTLRTSSDGNLDSERQRLNEALTPEQERQVTELVARDAEVRAHERAHKAVGGQYAGAITYDFQRGPDGKRYAVGGEVSIDTSVVSGDPQATIDKMNTVKAAALAPVDPSPQDRRVAAEAQQAIVSARVELRTQSQEESQEEPSGEGISGGTDNLRINGRRLASYEAISVLKDEPSTTKQFIDDLA